MNKPLILVVEDDAPVRNLITTTLKLHDYRFLTAANGETALEASSHNPDIILLDLGLPDMDGIEIIRQIRTWSMTPIIVISARSEDTDKIEALDNGADDYLTKPFAAEELLAAAGYSRNEEGQLIRRRSALSLTLAVNRDSVVKCSIARYIAKNLTELGMAVTVSELDWNDYTAALTAGNFDLYLGEVKLTADFDFTALVSGGLKQMKKLLSSSEVGGTALVGISKPVIKAHGSSDAYAVKNAIRQAVEFKKSGIIEDITENVEHMRLPVKAAHAKEEER